MKQLNKRPVLIGLMLAALIFTAQSVFAQSCDSTRSRTGNPRDYVDANGDGYNDNAPDHDNDGIPNGQDSDYVRTGGKGRGFIDSDGDGINDRIRDFDGDGVPNGRDSDYVRTRDGKGAGAGGRSRGRGFSREQCRGGGRPTQRGRGR